MERNRKRIRYNVNLSDGYVKVSHSLYGVIAAGNLINGQVRNIEFTEEHYRKANQIRQPAMKALIRWERHLREAIAEAN